MTGNEIREKFLSYFESKGHRRVRSSSLVPIGDPTLLFTNAGMNQFKDVFLGLEQRDYKRATTAQKCVRAGGKHNDLENVGFTKRHHTFFEMLGNFSFGDYYKEDAIAYAWELLTSPKWFNIPVDKLYFTVFGGALIPPNNQVGHDFIAVQSWASAGAPSERIIQLADAQGIKELFWSMGDTGPCGSCSEIHYDMGPAASEQGHTDCKFPCDCGRYVEIWNLVFMQWNRDATGNFTPLPKPSVDTGAGLERLAAVVQGKLSNFDTDLFVPLMQRAAELCGVNFEKEINLEAGKGGAASLRIIADHARATTFLITDGVLPSNEGRGYVLRKIIRRAIRHGRLLGVTQPFLFEMVHAVRQLMGDAYPELREAAAARVPEIVLSEEKRFSHTLDIGLRKLEDELKPLAAQKTAAPAIYTGESAFRLYDTYGLPMDFIVDAARDLGIQFDETGFERAMNEQRTRARASWKGGAKEAANPAYAKLAETFRTEADFYQSTNTRDCRIEAIVTKRGVVHEIQAGETAEIVLYPVTGLIAHKVVAKETLRTGDRVAVVADAARREQIKRNHTGTHLVHAALRNILGAHVKQAGSLNAPERLRFDFSHFTHVAPEELRDIEQQVNEEIRQNAEIETAVTSLEDALASGALAFFGDKYPEHNVRVVTIPDPRSPRGFYSKELCGGTHVRRIGDIGVLKIVSEQSVAAGVRRIEAITGGGALEHYQQQAQLLTQIASALNVGEEALQATVEKLAHTARQLEKELEAQKRKGALGQMDELASRVRLVKGVKVIAEEVTGVDRESFRQLVDSLRQKLGSGVVALGTIDDGKVSLIVGVTKDLTNRVHAGKLVQALAKLVGGSGGGRPDLAEAGGKDTSALKSTLQTLPSLLDTLL
ncbi:MAG: alanine--tRNA ligase [Acidobacteriia bacterium]|nr:alanine--tRNA ligase [Terriglobia bacterium]